MIETAMANVVGRVFYADDRIADAVCEEDAKHRRQHQFAEVRLDSLDQKRGFQRKGDLLDVDVNKLVDFFLYSMVVESNE